MAGSTSRRRKVAKTPLLQFKNALRGTRNRTLALSELRRKLPEGDLPAAARWSLHAYSVAGPLKGLRARSIAQLFSEPAMGALPLPRELEWVRSLLRESEEALKSFIHHRRKFEDALQESDADHAIYALDEIEKACGFSFWGIEQRIAVLQLFQGLERQKEWISSEHFATAQPMVRFFAYWFSVRAEENNSYESFVRDLKTRLYRWQIDEATRDAIAYLLLGELSPPDRYSGLISTLASGSVVDLYLGLGAIAEREISVGTSIPELKDLVTEFADRFGDRYAAKLAFLGGREADLGVLPTASTVYRDTLFGTGDVSNQLPDPRGLEERLAAARMNLELQSGPLWGRIDEAIRDLDLPGPENRNAQRELQKLGLTLGRTGVGRLCRALASEDADELILPSQFLVDRYLASEDLDVLALPPCDFETRERYLQSLKATFGTTPLLIDAAVRSGEPIGDYAGFLSGMSVERSEALQVFAAISGSDFAGSLAIIANSSGSGANDRAFLKTEVLSLLAMGKIEEAAKLAVSRYSEDPRILTWIPLKTLTDHLRGAASSLTHIAEPAILFELMAQTDPTAYTSMTAYAVEDHLLHFGVERPSQLFELPEFVLSTSNYLFLLNACTPAYLRLSTAYLTEAEVEDERISICGYLAREQDERVELLEEEAQAIVRGRAVRAALKELQRSRVSLDRDALKTLFRNDLSELYDRYVAMLRGGVAVVDASFLEELEDALGTGDFTSPGLDIPTNEASALLASIVLQMANEMAFNPEHGFDSYLSLRIRHGTLSGLLRGAVEGEHLVTRRQAASEKYAPNEHWQAAMSSTTPPWALDQIDERLAAFSKNYDAVLRHWTTDLVQIKRPDKPDGLFDFAVAKISVMSLAAETTAETSFGDFTDKVFDYFWALAGAGLDRVRKRIEDDLRVELRQMLDTLENDLGQLYPDPALGPLLDATRRARVTVSAALDHMREWFTPPTEGSSLTFTIEELIHVGLATVQSFHSEFQPAIEINAEGLPKLLGALRLFSDIFHVLFENIYEHAGTMTPSVAITAKSDDTYIIVSVTSEVLDPAAHLVRVRDAKSRIESGTYKSAVRSDKGSGLPKLAKLIGKNGEVQFGIDDTKNTFTLEFKLRLRVLSVGAVSDEIADS